MRTLDKPLYLKPVHCQCFGLISHLPTKPEMIHVCLQLMQEHEPSDDRVFVFHIRVSAFCVMEIAS